MASPLADMFKQAISGPKTPKAPPPAKPEIPGKSPPKLGKKK